MLMIIKRRWGSRINRWDPYHVKRIVFNKNCRCKIILNNSFCSFHFPFVIHQSFFCNMYSRWIALERQAAMSWNGNFFIIIKKIFRMLIGILQQFPSNFISFYSLLSVSLLNNFFFNIQPMWWKKCTRIQQKKYFNLLCSGVCWSVLSKIFINF